MKGAFSEARAQFLSDLMAASREGHLCIRSNSVPEFPQEIIQEGGDELQPPSPVVRDQDRYYLQRNWVLETYLLQQVQRLRQLSPVSCHNQEMFVKDLGEAPLLGFQKEAVRNAFENSFSIICGGPGTGKTYTAAILVRLLRASAAKGNYKVIVSAPTGKAASHLHSVLNGQAQSATLHRLLRIEPGQVKLFSSRKIDADLVIVDEASMIDTPLFAQLLESIGNETRLVLMGDPDQLPPVDAAGLFAEMAALFGTRLDTSLRAQNGRLRSLAEQAGIGGEIDPSYFLNWPFDSSLAQKLYEKIDPFISWEKPEPIDVFRKLDQFRVLGALRQGPYGIDLLNHQIVDEMGRRIRPGQWWAIPILITKNHPSLGLFNGTCGVLIGKSGGGLQLRDSTAYFQDGFSLPFKMLPPFEWAFCLSIHKSQGSEFENVLALFPQGSENFGREAFYTAVTRAKKEVEIVSEMSTLNMMMAKRSSKISGFTERFFLDQYN